MFPINLSLKWLVPFLVFTLGLIAVCAIWIIREWDQPEWKQRQRAEYAEMRADLQKQLTILEDPTWGDPKKAKMAKKTIEYLEKPSLQVKQILLKGTGLWKEGRSGVRVDRCMTCHINEDKLSKMHPYTVEHFPFDIYGCTVCHHGNGRALRSENAHEGMFRNKRDMEKRLARPEDILNLWKEFATLSLQEELKPSDFKYFNVSGERQIYIGSTNCIKCHKKLTAFHVNEWTGNKFITFEKMKQAKDYIEGDETYRKQCLKCHTTGYNEKTGEYAEENVTCEACHGPGEIYSQFMSTGKIAEAATLSEHSFDFKVCGDCHIPRRHEMRQAMLLAAKERRDRSLDLSEDRPEGLSLQASALKEAAEELDILFRGEDSQEVVMASKDLASTVGVPRADNPVSSEMGASTPGEPVALSSGPNIPIYSPDAPSPGQEKLDSFAFKNETVGTEPHVYSPGALPPGLAEMDGYRDRPAQIMAGLPQARSLDLSEDRPEGLSLQLAQERLDSLAFKGEQLAEMEECRDRSLDLSLDKPKGLSLHRKEESTSSRWSLKAKLKAFKALGAKEARLKEKGSQG